MSEKANNNIEKMKRVFKMKKIFDKEVKESSIKQTLTQVLILSLMG